MEQRIVFVDIETGGLDPKKHPVIQIGAAAVDGSLEVLEAFEAKIQFDERRANRNPRTRVGRAPRFGLVAGCRHCSTYPLV
jgi:oligoribonuclease (3'-5' exoribonuclease)